MNLLLEVILSLVLEILIGLWLIWQAIKINSNTDIFKIVVNWFTDRPIILPSLVFLIFIFLAAHIIQDLLKVNNVDIINSSFNNIYIIDKVFEKILYVLAFLIGNSFLEGFKNNQGKIKLAKIIIASMESHLDNLEEILKYLNEKLSESLMNRINNKVNQIRKNYIYESALKEVGILTSKHIDIISKSSISLNYIIDETPRVYDLQNKSEDAKSKKYVRIGIEEIVINIKLDIMVLSREILQDNEKFNTYREKVKDVYSQMKIHINESCLLDEHEQRTSNIHYSSQNMEGILERIETLFDGYSLLTELNDSYNKKKIEFERKRNIDFF